MGIPTPLRPAVDMATHILTKDEGRRSRVYDDLDGRDYFEKVHDFVLAADDAGLEPIPLGNPTIGVGRDLDSRPLSDAAIDFLLTEDLEENLPIARRWMGHRLAEVETPPPDGPDTVKVYDFDKLSPPRQAVLLCLAHWGGLTGAPMFRDFLREALQTIPYTERLAVYAAAGQELLWKDGEDHSRGRSMWWDISQADKPGHQRIERYESMIRTGRLHPFYKGDR